MRTIIFACFFLLGAGSIFAQNTTKQAIIKPSTNGTAAAPNGGGSGSNDDIGGGGTNQEVDEKDIPEIDEPNFDIPDIP